jgi:RND family efflux transporter MFP subunit
MRLRFGLAAAAIAAGGIYILAPVLTGRPWVQLIADASGSGRGLLENSVRPQAVVAPVGTQAAAPPAVVAVSQPLRRDIVEWDEAVGRFDAVETVDLRARVNGYLQQVLFKDGQDVAKGDTLFVIDPRPYERVLAQAKAELEQAETKIANANLDVERARPLVERKVVSGKVFDDRENLVRDGQAQARIAEEKVKSAELDLSFTRVIAPVTGRIGRASVTPGNFVTAGGASGVTTLASIVSQDPIYLYFDITEGDALKYKRLAEKGSLTAAKTGARVEAGLPDEKGFPHAGQIDFLDNRLDAATGSQKARAVFANPTRLFTPGQFAKLRLQGSEAYVATLVPDEAVGADQGNRYVVVVGTDDVPVRKTVKLGPLVDGLRVVREGLDADAWIVVKGLTRVRPGQKVAPKREPLTVSQDARPVGGVTR